jgi:hypothetical protein
MERRGLLTRQRDADGRRPNVSVLTAEDRSELGRLRPGVDEVQRELTCRCRSAMRWARRCGGYSAPREWSPCVRRTAQRAAGPPGGRVSRPPTCTITSHRDSR